MIWRRTLQKLPTLPWRTRNLALWIGGPVFFLPLFLALGSIAMFPGYFVAWYIFAGLGVFAGLVYRQGPIRSVLYSFVVFAIVLFALQVSSEPLPDALTLIFLAFSFAIGSSWSGGGGGSGGGGASSS